MQKRKFGKKLSVSKETLRRLVPGELQQVPGGAEAAPLPSAASDCFWGTCGPNSCLRVCSLNCSWLCVEEAAPIDGHIGVVGR